MFTGVDIGGTFTDFVAVDNGRLRIHKQLSTPDDPARAMLFGLAELSGGDLTAIARLAHGSTVATNAILERKGARAAFLTTEGFRDILAIGRQNRPRLYALQPQLPPPLIPRELCFEVRERLDFQGRVLKPLDYTALDATLDTLKAQGVESVAVCLLHSYANPVHEQAVRQRAVERGCFQPEQIVLSSDVLPQFREYERASTTALEAYVRPVVGRYLRRLEAALPPSLPLSMMKSDGGTFSAAAARQLAAHTALSGPAAGVIGAFHLAQLAGFDRIITLDMGGTSTDVALCPGEPVLRAESEIDGLPLRVRLLDIETVGAGGGSIARIDAGGALRVGPESAGADPGPVAYGRGGDRVTVTDANVVLGRLDPAYFLGGGMSLDTAAATAAVERLAGLLGMDVESAALGVLEVANSNIERALRRVSVARGHDPRAFTLMAFGGAGPLHACDVAARLQIPRVLVPRYPGVLCAFGLLVADVRLDYSRSVLGPLTAETVQALRAHINDLEAEARAALDAEGVAEPEMIFRPSVDMRYQGQAYELSVPYGDDLAERFHRLHEQTYGHALRDRAVEVVTLRLEATCITRKPALEPELLEANAAPSARIGQRADGVAIYLREKLSPGSAFHGPALVVQLDSTVYVAPGWSARVDAYRNLILEPA
ncbi:MAG: hydantoinase/oxoprolinase family protein [Chloroflexota bacterium]|nr:MAG: 5-oxoprolinase [Chloroflexota bacterium]